MHAAESAMRAGSQKASFRDTTGGYRSAASGLDPSAFQHGRILFWTSEEVVLL
jgi:hypothetical protein